MDNRDFEFCQRFIDGEIKDFANTIWNRFNGLCKRRPLREDEAGHLHCPGCWKLISREHAERKPNFCEECGQAFDWDNIQVNEVNFFDQEEIHHGCTVQILTNSITGHQSIGWWREGSLPKGESDDDT